MTRWLEKSCEIELTDRVLWNKLISFLEKDLKVEQQRLRVMGKQDKPSPPSKGPKGLFLADKLENLRCSLCGAKAGESDHIAMSGPGGIKLIQYFSCRTFVEKTPAQRFSLLRRKGLCFQCLYPGAEWNKGKHSDGKCQHEFVCP